MDLNNLIGDPLSPKMIFYGNMLGLGVEYRKSPGSNSNSNSTTLKFDKNSTVKISRIKFDINSTDYKI
jgi:hypothetical protein